MLNRENRLNNDGVMTIWKRKTAIW